MKPRHRIPVLFLALLAAGAVRLPFEISLTRELRAANLLPPPLAIGTREKIGQTSSAVALGGLRTLVATFLNLRAFSFFSDQRWSDVESTYETIVDLAPRTRYYWDTGSWHLAYNAASYHLHDSRMPALRRREAWRSSIHKGRAFLERGVRNNPGDWQLLASLGQLLADSNKFPAFPDPAAAFAASAEAYRQAADTGRALPYVRRAQLYSLARVPGREAEALALAETLYRTPGNQTPTLLCLCFVLRMHAAPDKDAHAVALSIFGTDRRAYENLSAFWQRSRERFPLDGVAAALGVLERRLSIPPGDSVLNRPLPPFSGPDDWFSPR